MAMLPVLVMVATFSKFITALMIPSRTTADLLAGCGCCCPSNWARSRGG